MGLKSCFRAADRLWYPIWDKDRYCDPPWENYYNDLITSPRLYMEELACFRFGADPGLIWVSRESNHRSETTINYLGTTANAEWPSWGARQWKLDNQDGYAIETIPRGNFSGISMGNFAYEPPGFLWSFGGHPFTSGYAAALIDSVSLLPTEIELLNIAEWEAALGKSLLAIRDFNVNRSADRIWVRWMTDRWNHISVYRLSTKEFLADLYTPNATAGIVLTADGWVYVADTDDWICVYDYEGRYYNAFKNPRRETYFGGRGGYAKGWDPINKRLLFAGAVANSVNGQCRMRIVGYYPVAEPAALTIPLPRTVPRATRRTVFMSHLRGEGGEPLASRSTQITGAVTTTVATDQHGDILVTVTPSQSGTVELDMSVAATVPVPPSPEPQDVVVDRTLVVRIVRPAPPGYDDDTQFVATVEGAVGAVTVQFATSSGGALTYYQAAGQAGDAYFVAIHGPVSAWSVQAIAKDSTGNQGLSQAFML